MDIKKFFDQTVREVKREVNKKVLKVPEIEQKVYEATSNEPWGPHGTLMGDIAQATRNFNEYQMIMNILWKRLNDTGKNWRHVYKALTVLEYLIANGAERIIDELREHAYQVQTLVDFQYMEPGGRDQGVNVRKKAQSLVSLINDKDKIREVRSKAASNRDKFRGVSSNGSFTRGSNYSGSYSGGGGYGDRDQDDDRYGGSSRGGGRDEDRYGYGDRDRDRDDRYKDDRYKDDRYRDDDRSTRDSSGERYRDERDRDRYEDDRYGSRGYKDDKDRDDDRYVFRGYKDDKDREDDRYASKGGDGYNNDKYSDEKYEGSASGSNNRDRDRDRSFEEDERYPPRRQSGSGSKSEEFMDDREPSGLAAAVARAHSQVNLSQTSSNASEGPSQGLNQGTDRKVVASVIPGPSSAGVAATMGGSYFPSQASVPTDDFDDFDPRGSGSFSTSSAVRLDEYASNLSPVSVPVPSLPHAKSTSGIEDLFGDTSFQASFVAPPVSSTQMQGNSNGLQREDLFGSSAFSVAQPTETGVTAPAYFPTPANNVVNGKFSAYPSVVSSNELHGTFRSGSFMEPAPANLASVPPQTAFPPALPPSMLSCSSSKSFQGPSQGPSGSILAPTRNYTSGFNSQESIPHLSSGGAPYGLVSSTNVTNSQAPAVSMYGQSQQKPPQKSFQTKSSSLWSDTINSGLVDLNISGPKTNPLAELGIDLKDSIFSVQEKWKEEKAQPTGGNMGRAMGSGTGLGLAGASGIAPPPASMGGGMGLGMGGMRHLSMGMSMGVSGGYGMAPAMGVNMGYGSTPGMSLNPGYGVPSTGMAQGMGPGMAGYGPGVGMVPGMVPGGYGPGMGVSGYPPQQQQYSGFR